jgi:hypothetical protein
MLHLRDITFCHDEACPRGDTCQLFSERHSRKWANHALSLRPVGGDGWDCAFYLPPHQAPAAPLPWSSSHADGT